MSTDLLIHIFALVFLIVSFVLAVITNQLQSAMLWGIWSIAIIVVFSGFPLLGK